MTVEKLLKQRFPAELADALLTAYKDIEENYSLGKWKASEVDAGQFVEAARRIIESELNAGKFTPLDQKLPNFHQGVLTQYEQGNMDESFRTLIPRILYGIYAVRSKRGGGHLAGVSPNVMDATLVLGNVKWVLAEMVRIASGLPAAQTQKLLDEIVERKLDILWKRGNITRILDTSFKTTEQILILLYDKSPQMVEELQQTIEYSNASRFRKLLVGLHDKRFIEVMRDGTCVSTQKGVLEAEALLRKRKIALG